MVQPLGANSRPCPCHGIFAGFYSQARPCAPPSRPHHPLPRTRVHVVYLGVASPCARTDGWIQLSIMDGHKRDWSLRVPPQAASLLMMNGASASYVVPAGWAHEQIGQFIPQVSSWLYSGCPRSSAVSAAPARPASALATVNGQEPSPRAVRPTLASRGLSVSRLGFVPARALKRAGGSFEVGSANYLCVLLLVTCSVPGYGRAKEPTSKLLRKPEVYSPRNDARGRSRNKQGNQGRESLGWARGVAPLAPRPSSPHQSQSSPHALRDEKSGINRAGQGRGQDDRAMPRDAALAWLDGRAAPRLGSPGVSRLGWLG